jgi:hypothetical protein
MRTSHQPLLRWIETVAQDLRLGRTFSGGEAAPERSPRAVILDHPYWNARFGADPNAIGQTIVLDGEPFTVAGILPERLPIGHRVHDAERVENGNRACFHEMHWPSQGTHSADIGFSPGAGAVTRQLRPGLVPVPLESQAGSLTHSP